MKKTIIKETIPDNINNKTNSKYEFHSIKAGDACLYEGTERELINARSAAIEYAKRHKLHFITRTNEKGLLVYNVTKTSNEGRQNNYTQNKQTESTFVDRPKPPASSLAAQLESSGIKPHNPFGD